MVVDVDKETGEDKAQVWDPGRAEDAAVAGRQVRVENASVPPAAQRRRISAGFPAMNRDAPNADNPWPGPENRDTAKR